MSGHDIAQAAELTRLEAENAALRQEAESLREDAKRWAFVRDTARGGSLDIDDTLLWRIKFRRGKTFTEAIDKARKQSREVQ